MLQGLPELAARGSHRLRRAPPRDPADRRGHPTAAGGLPLRILPGPGGGGDVLVSAAVPQAGDFFDPAGTSRVADWDQIESRLAAGSEQIGSELGVDLKHMRSSLRAGWGLVGTRFALTWTIRNGIS